MDDDYVITPDLGRRATVRTIVVPPPAPAPAPAPPAPAPAPAPVHVPVYERPIPYTGPPPAVYQSPTARSQGPQVQSSLGDPTISSTINYSPHLETNYSQNKSYYLKEGEGGGGAENWYLYPTQTGEILFDVSGFGQRALMTRAIPASPTQTELTWENSSIMPYTWYNYATQTGVIGFSDASGGHDLQSIQGNLYYDGELLARAGDIQDIAAWADYPAVADVNLNNHGITGGTDITISGTLDSDVVTTTTIGCANLNATTADLIETNTETLNIGTLAAPEVGGIPTILTQLTGGNITTSGDISGATLHISGTGHIHDIDLSGCALTSNAGGTALFVNGVQVQTGSPADVSQWATYPAVATVDVSGQSLNMTGSLVPPATNKFGIGTAVAPIGINDQYAFSTNIYNMSPIGAMNIASNSSMSITTTSTTGTNEMNISLVGAAGEDMNITAPDINLTMTDPASFMNLTAPFGIAVAGGGFFLLSGVMENVGLGDITLLSSGNIRIGSGNVGGATTQIEKFEFLDFNVSPMNGVNHLILNNIEIKNVRADAGGEGIFAGELKIGCISAIRSIITSNNTSSEKVTFDVQVDYGTSITKAMNLTSLGTGPIAFNMSANGNTLSLTYDSGKAVTWASTGGPVQFQGVSEVDLQQNGGVGVCKLTTSSDGTQLLVNGVAVATGANLALWAAYPASQDIDVSGHNIKNCGDISANTGHFGSIVASGDISGGSGHFGPLYTSDTLIHLGSGAGIGQDANSIAIGVGAGALLGKSAIAIGQDAGTEGGIATGPASIAIGNNAGQLAGDTAVSLGYYSGYGAGDGSVSLGANSGYNISNYFVDIGYNAPPYTASGGTNGDFHIYIGSVPDTFTAPISGPAANSITLNATGAPLLNSPNAGEFYVSPIQPLNGSPDFGILGHRPELGLIRRGTTTITQVENTVTNTQQISYDTGLLTTTINGISQLQTVKAAGPVTIGTPSALSTLTVAGTIAIQDASGNTATQVVAQPAFVYYVATNGRVGATGAITDPLKYINDALAKAAGVGGGRPGMTIYLAPGAYTEDVVINISATLPAVSILGMGDDDRESKRVQLTGSVTVNGTDVTFTNTIDTVVLNNLTLIAKNTTTSALTITGSGIRVYLKNGLFTNQTVATAPLISLSSTGVLPSTVAQLIIDDCSLTMDSATASGHLISMASGQLFNIGYSDLTHKGTGSAINMAGGAFGSANNSSFNSNGAVMALTSSAASLISLTNCLVSGKASPTVALITCGTNSNLNLTDCTIQNTNTTEANSTSRYVYLTAGVLVSSIRNNYSSSASPAITLMQPYQSTTPASSILFYFSNIYTNASNTVRTILPTWAAVQQFSNDITPPTSVLRATSGTAITLSPTTRGNTYILTGTTTQAFTAVGLVASDVGYFVVVHNGNGVAGGDINLTGMTGTAIVHNRTATQNGGVLYLYWTGAALVGY